jgi:hypothetical protein
VITRLEELDCRVVTYTACSESGPTVSLASTSDFVHFERNGAVMPLEDKEAALFPRKFNNEWFLLPRPRGRLLYLSCYRRSSGSAFIYKNLSGSAGFPLVLSVRGMMLERPCSGIMF